jgi:hypothetical protein
MKKIISFSLWGDDPRYVDGAFRNVELAADCYEGWLCRFHIGDSTPDSVVSRLREYDNTEIISRTEPCNWTGMFWRFEDASDPTVDVMMSRDCDSRLTFREAAAVNEWLESDKGFHIMRDHPYHAIPIMGGMWGAKKGTVPQMKALIGQAMKGDFWQVDQNFLTKEIYPLVKMNSFVHDEFFQKRPFPYPRDEKHFVGQAYAGNDQILDADEFFIDRVKESLNQK